MGVKHTPKYTKQEEDQWNGKGSERFELDVRDPNGMASDFAELMCSLKPCQETEVCGLHKNINTSCT